MIFWLIKYIVLEVVLLTFNLNSMNVNFLAGQNIFEYDGKKYYFKFKDIDKILNELIV